MLKKTILASAAFAMSSGFAFANGGVFIPPPAHHGDFYIGVGGSRDDADWKASTTSLANITTAFTEFPGSTFTLSQSRAGDMGGEGWNAALYLGYGWVFKDHYYLAAEAFGSVSDIQGLFDYQKDFTNATPAAPGINTAFNQSQQAEMKNTLGIAAIPGIIVAPGSMFYGRIAYVNSKFDITGYTIETPITGFAPVPSFSKNASGIQLGLGVNTQVSNHISIREGYTWNKYASFSGINSAFLRVTSAPASTTFTSSQAANLQPEVEAFTLDVLYHFFPTDNGSNRVTLPAHIGHQWYIGIDGSRDTIATDYNRSDLIIDNSDPLSPVPELFNPNTEAPDLKARGWGGDLFGGFGYTFSNRYYLAAEIFGSVSSADATENFVANASTNGATTFAEANHLKFDLQHTYGIALLPGYQVSDAALIYARIGVVQSRFKFNYNATSTGLNPISDSVSTNAAATNLTGIQVGLGVDTTIYKNLSVRTEFDWTGYENGLSASHTLPDLTSSEIRSVTHSFSGITTDQFKVALIYHMY